MVRGGLKGEYRGSGFFSVCQCKFSPWVFVSIVTIIRASFLFSDVVIMALVLVFILKYLLPVYYQPQEAIENPIISPC